MLSKAALYSANLLFRVSPTAYRPLYFSYKRWHDAYILRLLAERIKPGDTVLDIGANIGFFSVQMAAMVGERGMVLAFEPDARNFTELQKSVRGLPQVVLHNLAVGAEDGNILLYHSPVLNVDHRTYAHAGNLKRTSVPMRRIDGFDWADRHVKLVKMDIQGFEFQALQGMKDLLFNQRPQIIMEFWPWGLQQAGSSAADVLELLENAGYEVLLIRPQIGRIEPLNDKALESLTISESIYYNILANPLN